MRIRNHLRQTHHVPLIDLQEAVDACLPILEINSEEESEAPMTDSEYDRRDRKTRMERHFVEDIAFRENAMAQPESDDEDYDWFGNQYFKDKDKTMLVIPESRGEPEIDNGGESGNEDKDVEEPCSSADEDDENTFYMSSVDEDSLLKDFTQWLSSMDGGSKNPEQAKKHKSTLQSIVRFDGESMLYTMYILVKVATKLFFKV